MSDQTGPSRLEVLFEAALQDYETQTGIVLAKHPLAEQLQNCASVESVTVVLREQTQVFNEFRGGDKVMKLLKNAVSVLHKLSATADLGQGIGLDFPPITAIQTGLAVLLSAAKGVIDSYDALVDLLELIEHFLIRLDIYTKIPPTVAMTEMVVKILVELLSALALVTKQIKQGKPKKLVKKLLGEKDVEAVIQRLDRLTLDEARITAAQTLEAVYGLAQSMRARMDDGEASVECVRGALRTMQQVTSDVNKSKRGKFEKSMRSWLSPADPWKNHNIACKSRHLGSAAWFVQGDVFSDWKASEARGSLLWVHGKPGAGKSVLCSTIIEDIDAMRKAGLASLAFFYCDFREDQKKDLRGLLSSLLVQLSRQSDSYWDILFKLYSEHADGSHHPSDDALVGCLESLLKLPGQAPVYIIVDALDECPSTSAVPSPRDEVLSLIEGLVKSRFPNLRICVTSRPETDIKDVLDPLIFRSVSLHDESGQKRDIGEYIKSVVNTNPKNRRWKADDRQLVIDTLTEKADGMFRWVYCQVVYICGLIPARIRQALAELPETLDETYQRSLREINRAEWEIAHRLFQFVAVACRPLRVKELAELLAFDFEDGPIPKFNEGWRLEDPVDAVLSTCSSLLAIVDGGQFSDKVIQFSHFSVKEFLTSPRLAEANDVTSRRYHISMTPAHTLAAQACLGILLHLDKNVVDLDDFPLARYAAVHWIDHVRSEDVSRNVEDGMKQLFDPSKPHLAVCIWMYDPVGPPRRRNRRPEQPLSTCNFPLHYAALWGLHSIVEFLVIEHAQDVNSRGFIDNATSLHLASEKGHVEVTRFLLKHDADVTAQNYYGSTPLHLALLYEQLEVASMLIEHGADVSAQSNDRSTPLHLALERGQAEVASMLIERGADVAAKNNYGSTPLHLALQEGPGHWHMGIVAMLIERGADVMVQNEDGDTPLHLASQGGLLEAVRMIIERGGDVTARNEDGSTPLHLALLDEQPEVVDMLITHGGDVTAQNKCGSTPLHLASQEGLLNVARMLIEHRADVSAQNEDGSTPLHLALQSGRTEVACMLIERGADVTAQSKYGLTPLHLASLKGQVEVAGMLIELGADLTTQNEDGETPLHLALQTGQVEVAGMLIKRGADVTVQNNHGSTPLHLASLHGHVEVAGTLIEHGAAVTAQNQYGESPLHLASLYGQAEVVGVLIERGADATAQNRDGSTPLHLASTRSDRTEMSPERYAGVVRVLLENGADATVRDRDGWTAFDLASSGRGHAEVEHVFLRHTADPGTYENTS